MRLLDMLNGVIPMNELVEIVITENDDKKIMEFAHALAVILEKTPHSDSVTLCSASKALGQIIQAGEGGTTLIEFIEEYHLRPSLMWLEKDIFQVRRRASVLILKELASSAPSLFTRYLDNFFQVIWSAINDTKIQIREDAAEALQSALSLVAQREEPWNRKLIWYNKSLEEAEKSMIKKTPEAIHGSLLTLNELLRNSNDFMNIHYDKVCKQIINYKDHKSLLIRRSVISLFPRLAKFNPNLFKLNYHELCLLHLLEILGDTNDSTVLPTTIKGDALLAVGKLALALGTQSFIKTEKIFIEIMQDIFRNLLEDIPDTTNNEYILTGSQIEKDAFSCLNMISENLTDSDPVAKDVTNRLIVSLFGKKNITVTFINAIRLVANKMPSQKSFIEMKLFQRLASILMRYLPSSSAEFNELKNQIFGEKIEEPIYKPRSKTSSFSGIRKSSTFLSLLSSKNSTNKKIERIPENQLICDDLIVPNGSYKPKSKEIILAIETLSNFDFSGQTDIKIFTFMECIMMKYLDNDNPVIRNASIISSAKILHSIYYKNHYVESDYLYDEKRETISERDLLRILKRLLCVVTADIEPQIRVDFLRLLNTKDFNGLITQDSVTFFHLFSSSFYDFQNIEVRIIIINLICKLAVDNCKSNNNIYITVEYVRKFLLFLLSNLNSPGINSPSKDADNYLLLNTFISSCKPLMQPYILITAEAVVSKLNLTENSPFLISCIGELAEISGSDLYSYLPRILPLFIRSLEINILNKDDISNAIELQTLIAMGKVCRNTCYVTRPFHDYPNLFTLLLKSLVKPGEKHINIRLEAGRTFGILGAISPQLMQITSINNNDEKQIKDDKKPSSLDANGCYSPRVKKQGVSDINNRQFERIEVIPPEEMMPFSVDDFFPAVAINALILIVNNNDNSSHYQSAIHALMYICRSFSNSNRIEDHLKKIIPTFLFAFERSNDACDDGTETVLAKFILEQLSLLPTIICKKKFIKKSFPTVILKKLITKYWDSYLTLLLNLVESLAKILMNDFLVYIPDIIPQLLYTLDEISARKATDINKDHTEKIKQVLHTLVQLAPVLNSYSHLIIPTLVNLSSFDLSSNRIDGTSSKNNDINIDETSIFFLRKQSLRSLLLMIKHIDVSRYSCQLIQMVTKIIMAARNDLFAYCMELLILLISFVKDDFIIFIPLIDQALKTSRNILSTGDNTNETSLITIEILTSINTIKPANGGDIIDTYHLFVSKLLRKKSLPRIVWKIQSKTVTTMLNQDDAKDGKENQKSISINQVGLMKAWDTSQKATADDWNEWLRAFSVEILRESPSPFLRSCKDLASVYYPLSIQLLPSCFLSIYSSLMPLTQDNLVYSLETVFSNENTPKALLKVLLQIVEFMEHEDQPLPLSMSLLSKLALKVKNYGKALYYKEMEYRNKPSQQAADSLANINNKLSLNDAACGILKFSFPNREKSEKSPNAFWYENMHKYDEALEKYDQDLLKNDNRNLEAHFGKMRCLYNCGEWRKLYGHIKLIWADVYDHDIESNIETYYSASHNFRRGSLGGLSNLSETSIIQEDSKTKNFEKYYDDIDESNNVSSVLRKELCSYGARAAVMLQSWDDLPQYYNSRDMERTESSFYELIHMYKKFNYDDKISTIKTKMNKLRELLDMQIRKILKDERQSNSSIFYSKIYFPSVIYLQNLTDMEDIVDKNKDNFNLKNLWNKRMDGVERNPVIWQQLLVTRSLLFEPKDDYEIYLKYIKLQLRIKRTHLNLVNNVLWQIGAQPFIRSIAKDPHAPLSLSLYGPTTFQPHPEIALYYLRYLWAENKQDVALLQLSYYIESLEERCANSVNNKAMRKTLISEEKVLQELTRLRVKAYIQLSEWHISLYKPINMTKGDIEVDKSIHQVLACLTTATELAPCSYKAWHKWAFMNLRASQKYKNDSSSSNYVTYIVNAIKGFFRSLLLALKKNMKIPANNNIESSKINEFRNRDDKECYYDFSRDVLRLLSLWFEYGQNAEVNDAVKEGIEEIPVDTWLNVIPQLIARLYIPKNSKMNILLNRLLIKIGKKHPQALVYPIITVINSMDSPDAKVEEEGHDKKKLAATNILNELRKKYGKLVKEAEIVSKELIRVSILYVELWYGALEEASRFFFNMNNVNLMIKVLEPYHLLLEKMHDFDTGKTNQNEFNKPTLREVAFYHSFYRDLQCARDWTNKYLKKNMNNESNKNLNDINDINQAWDIYYNVFGKIKKQLGNLRCLKLKNVAPSLLSINNLSLAIPGTYKNKDLPIVRIKKFDKNMTVLQSKQRPRKITIYGSNNQAYCFLLKGHEDLRQDERVMQLFQLINKLLKNKSEKQSRWLNITSFSVVPLSHVSGLIEWVPNCDTLHQLIKDYRETRKIQLNVEHKLVTQHAPEYDKLTVIQKIEAFEYALSETSGQDLHKILWLKSINSETWVKRRENYTRSLAVMSMVGYILGLGDRHPSNLMIDRDSGKVVHIDFGDCFDVAQERTKYPEKVPFRLTRMLVNAMEASGIEGNFRITCENTMEILRNNKESLMAILEAFVYDPLMTWRLLTPTKNIPSKINYDQENTEKKNYINKMNIKNEPLISENDPFKGNSYQLNFSSSYHKKSTENMDTLNKQLYKVTDNIKSEKLNEKALNVIERVEKKLTGNDFMMEDGKNQLSIDIQVEKLIKEATSHENLCQLYYGWCPFW